MRYKSLIARRVVRLLRMVGVLSLAWFVHGCSGDEESELVGTWADNDSDSVWEFSSDGSIEILTSYDSFAGYGLRGRPKKARPRKAWYKRTEEGEITLRLSRSKKGSYRWTAAFQDNVLVIKKKGKELFRLTKDQDVMKQVEARNTQMSACAANLSQLWKMQESYQKSGGGRRRPFIRKKGSAFWLELSRTSPTPILPESKRGLYRCPLRTTSGAKKRVDYRGPNEDVNRKSDGHFVGACLDNHPNGSGVVVRKTGDLHIVQKGSSVYKQALRSTAH